MIWLSLCKARNSNVTKSSFKRTSTYKMQFRHKSKMKNNNLGRCRHVLRFTCQHGLINRLFSILFISTTRAPSSWRRRVFKANLRSCLTYGELQCTFTVKWRILNIISKLISSSSSCSHVALVTIKFWKKKYLSNLFLMENFYKFL